MRSLTFMLALLVLSFSTARALDDASFVAARLAARVGSLVRQQLVDVSALVRDDVALLGGDEQAAISVLSAALRREGRFLDSIAEAVVRSANLPPAAEPAAGRSLQQHEPRSEPLRLLSHVLGLTPEMIRSIEAELPPLLASEASAGLELERPVRVHHQPSKSFMQEAFVRFHAFLFVNGFLPLSNWGEGRDSHNIDEACIGRQAFIKFNAQASATHVKPRSRCLGWRVASASNRRCGNIISPRSHSHNQSPGSNRARARDNTKHTALLKNCDAARTPIFRFETDGGTPRPVRVSHGGKMITGDLVSMADEVMLPEGSVRHQFDLVLCNQVFEHVAQPFAAARGLYNLLRPGGIALWSAPFLERFHRIPADHFRYTLTGATELFRNAGFEVVATYKIGDSRIASGYTMGFGVGDFEPSYLRKHLLNPMHNESEVNQAAVLRNEWLYTGTALVLRRPAPSPTSP